MNLVFECRTAAESAGCAVGLTTVGDTDVALLSVVAKKKNIDQKYLLCCCKNTSIMKLPGCLCFLSIGDKAPGGQLRTQFMCESALS